MSCTKINRSVAQVAYHCRNIEVIAEITRRHRAESAGAVGSREASAKKGWIVNLPFGADLLRWLFVMRRDFFFPRRKRAIRRRRGAGALLRVCARRRRGQRFAARVEQALRRRVEAGRD